MSRSSPSRRCALLFALAVLVSPWAQADDAQPQVRYQPLDAAAAEVSRSLLQHVLSDPQRSTRALLDGADRVQLGPFISAELVRTAPELAARTRSARLRLPLGESLQVSTLVRALTRDEHAQAVLDWLRKELLAGGALTVRAPTPGELLLVWPNLGWDLHGGVWVLEAGERRVLIDLPSSADTDRFVYIETLEASRSCFVLGKLAREAGAECLCPRISGDPVKPTITYRTECPTEPVGVGATVERFQPEEST